MTPHPFNLVREAYMVDNGAVLQTYILANKCEERANEYREELKNTIELKNLYNVINEERDNERRCKHGCPFNKWEENDLVRRMENALEKFNSRVSLYFRIKSEIEKLETKIRSTTSNRKKQLLTTQIDGLRSLNNSYETPLQRVVDNAINRAEDIIKSDPNKDKIEKILSNLENAINTEKAEKIKSNAQTIMQQTKQKIQNSAQLSDEETTQLENSISSLISDISITNSALQEMENKAHSLSKLANKEIKPQEKQVINNLIAEISKKKMLGTKEEILNLRDAINNQLKKQPTTYKKIEELKELDNQTKNHTDKQKLKALLDDLNKDTPTSTSDQVDQEINNIKGNNKKYDLLDQIIKDINNAINTATSTKKKEQLKAKRQELEAKKDGDLSQVTNESIEQDKQAVQALINSKPNLDTAKQLLQQLNTKKDQVKADIPNTQELEDLDNLINRVKEQVSKDEDIPDNILKPLMEERQQVEDKATTRQTTNKKLQDKIDEINQTEQKTASEIKKKLLKESSKVLANLKAQKPTPDQTQVNEAIKQADNAIKSNPNQLALQDAKDKLTQISTTAKTNKAKTEANTLLQQIAQYNNKPDSITDEVAKDITDKTDTLQKASTKADATLTQIKATIPALQSRLEKEIDTTEKEAIKAIITRVNDAENVKEFTDLDTLLQDINTLLKKQTVTDKKIKELQELLSKTKNQIEQEKITKILQDLNSTKPKTTLAQVDELIKVVTENNKKYDELDNLIKDINNELNNHNLPKEKKDQLEKLKKHLENMRDGYLDNTTTQDIKDQKEKAGKLIGSNPNADKAKSIIKNLEEKRTEVEKDITGTQELENLDNLIKDLKDKTKDPKAPELTDDYLMQLKDKIDQVKKNATTRQTTNKELQTKIDEINKALQSTKGSKKKDLLSKAKDSLSTLKAQKPTPTSQAVNEAKKLADTAISTKDDTPSTGGTTPSKPNTGSGSGGNTGSTGSSSSSGGGGGSSYHNGSYGGGGRGGSYSNKQQQATDKQQQTNKTKPQDNQTTPQQNPAPNKSEQKITFKDVPFAKGTGNNSFNPNKNLSKAEAIQMVMNVLEVKGYKVENSKAYDGKWYANTVNLARTTGILKDDSDLDSPLTRENFTNLIAELEKIMTGQNELKPKSLHFQDTNSPIINYFYEKNVVSGKSADKFNPNDNLTRAEAVAILNRLQGKQLKGTARQIYNDVPTTHWAFIEIYKASVDM